MGIACCQIANNLGAEVIGSAGTEDGMKAAMENGAKTVINHNQPGYTDEIKVSRLLLMARFA